MDKQTAIRVARAYVADLAARSQVDLILLDDATLDQEFGWVFFYRGSSSAPLAGNAPFIVDLHDGSIHTTGTAYPIENYLESYKRIRRTYPFAMPEYWVVMSSWKPGLLKISLTKLIQASKPCGLAEAKTETDRLLEGEAVEIRFPSKDAASAFCREAAEIGAVATEETRFR